MKISEIIKKIDKGKYNQDDYLELDIFAKELNICFDISGMHQDRLKAYWIYKWICDDTYVGEKIYFFDDEAVAYSRKYKSEEYLYWLSTESIKKVRDYILNEIVNYDELYNRLNIIDINEDIGDSYNLDYTSEIDDENSEEYWKKGLYKGKPFEFKEVIRKENSYLSSYIKIQQDDEELVIDINEINFSYNLIKEDY